MFITQTLHIWIYTKQNIFMENGMLYIYNAQLKSGWKNMEILKFYTRTQHMLI